MIKIIDWCQRHVAAHALVLIVLGDGQTVLRLRDLKRKHPGLYKNVLVCNGSFHSHAHFMFAVLQLWWKCILCKYVRAREKVHSVEPDCHTVPCRRRLAELLDKQMVGPDIKNLERNTYEHCLQFLMPIVVAIFVYLIGHVTSPPPRLLFSDPALYVSSLDFEQL